MGRGYFFRSEIVVRCNISTLVNSPPGPAPPQSPQLWGEVEFVRFSPQNWGAGGQAVGGFAYDLFLIYQSQDIF